VAITTRHDTHARFVLQALAARKDVFVEKPLCLTLEDLAAIELAHSKLTAEGASPRVMVGFNRRFAPHVLEMKKLLNAVAGPKAFVMTVNAGAIPANHWTQDINIGGGRIVGEACHFIDLLRFLGGTSITRLDVTALEAGPNDTATIQITFGDGSIGTVHYLSNGSKQFPKERVEVFAAGRVLQLDNYRKLTGFGWPGFTRMNLWRQDKGQSACADAFVRSVAEETPSPIPFGEIVEVSRLSIQAAEAVRAH
jgi:predicted dehydrogenase